MAKPSRSSHVLASKVYQQYGLAMHLAQTFEALVVDALVLTGQRSKRIAVDTLDSYEIALFPKTLGRLLERLGKETPLSEPLTKLLDEARELRNHLAHTYLHQTLKVKPMEKNLDHEINYLLDAQQTLRMATGQLHDVTETYAQILEQRRRLKHEGRTRLSRAKRLLKSRGKHEPIEPDEDIERLEDKCENCDSRYEVIITYSTTRADALRLPHPIRYVNQKCPKFGCGYPFTIAVRDTETVEVLVTLVDERRNQEEDW